MSNDDIHTRAYSSKYQQISLSLSPSANSVGNWSPSLIDKPSAVCVLNALIHLRVHQLSKINRISNALNMILNQHLFKARTQSEINETGLAAAAFVFQPMLLTLTDNGGTWLLPMFTFSKAFGRGRWLNRLRDLEKKDFCFSCKWVFWGSFWKMYELFIRKAVLE